MNKGVNYNYYKELIDRIAAAGASPAVIADAVSEYLATHPVSATWSGLSGKPSTFPPSTHSHDYAASSHGHQASEITDSSLMRFVTDTEKATWNGKADGNHNHDSAYAASNHTHNDYALSGHTHDVYSLTTHNHDGVYAPASTSALGMAINVQALTSSPTDAQTIYFGMLPKAPVTAAGTSKVYIRKACTLKIAEIYCYSGTAGTAENWSIYVRKNNLSDTLIATLGVSTNARVFSNTGLSVSFAAGDYFEIKSVNPTWATNPLTTIFGGYLYFE